MTRRIRDHRNTTQDAEQAEKILKAHIHELGLSTIPEYKQWCREHSFSANIRKSRQQRQRERLIVLRQAADSQLARSRRESRNPRDSIAQIFRGDLDGVNVRHHQLQAVCRAYKAVKKDRLVKRALERLLSHVQPLTDLLNHRRALAHVTGQHGRTFVDGLTALAFHWPSWIRELEDWKPRTHNARRQFASLARHLIAEYDVPGFMDSAWFKGTSGQGVQQQRWFIHIARGNNVRTTQLPIPFTKRMAHHFIQAPNDYTIEAALRWGQIHGWGGDARLADSIRGTRLCDSFDNDDFWATVLRFFIDNPMLDTVHIGPIIDYLHHKRFVSEEVFVAPGVIQRQPPEQPNLCMKRRTADSLLRQVLRWHRQLGKESHSNAQWSGSGIGDYEFLEGRKGSKNMKRWTIRELLSGRELNAEGRAMRHCVASYAGSCARRATSIWSMEVEDFEGNQRVLTIEVRLGARLICQARGKCNAKPGEKARKIMQRWASDKGLTIANYV